MAQRTKCALVVTDGKEGSLIPSRFGKGQRSTLLEYVLDSVWTVADEIFVLFDHEPELASVESIAPMGARVVLAKHKSGPLAQIASGMKESASDVCLVVPSSSPFVKPSLLYHLFESIQDYQAAVPRWGNGKTEPLLAVYNRRAFLRAASTLRNSSLAGLVDDLEDVVYVEVEKVLRPLDPDLGSFFRIQSAADLRRAKSMAKSSA